MKTPDTTSFKAVGDLGFRVVTPCSEALGTEGTIDGAVYGESAAFAVFGRIGDTYSWRTAPPGDFTVSWTFPDGASSATLLVEGVGYSQTYANLSATSQLLSLPAAAEGNENVYNLTLTFNDGTVKTASLGRIRGAVQGSAATIRYSPVPADTSVAQRASKVSVFAIPPETSALQVDGVDLPFASGAGYLAWLCPDREPHALSLTVGEDETYEATLKLRKAIVLILR